MIKFFYITILSVFLLNISLSSFAKQRILEDSSQVKHRAIAKARIDKFKNNKNFKYDIETPRRDESWIDVIFHYINELFMYFFSNEGFFPWIRWTIIIICIILVLLKIFKTTFLNLFYTEKATSSKTKYSIAEEDIMEINLDEEIDKQISVKNYRLAIRYLYLKALKNLSSSKKIEWKINKTNYEYYLELRKNTDLQKDFGDITQLYEYAWYGDFPIISEVFPTIQSQFNKFYQKVPIL